MLKRRRMLVYIALGEEEDVATAVCYDKRAQSAER